MSDTGGSLRVKPNTRSSIRQSLNNFASVGKAFADVINKERGDIDKLAKKNGKESHKSGLSLKPRASLDSRPSPPPAKRARTPDSKTITARRRSSLATASISTRNSVDEAGSSKPPVQTSVPARSSVLRPRPGSASNLPKYRPKSIVSENGKKPASPGLSGSRKRTSTSDDEDKSSSGDMALDAPQNATAKKSRPISPLPQRATAKSSAIHVKPKSNTPKADTPSSVRASPNSVRASPNRMKAVKTAGSIPRPSSSSSSSSSFSPRTPKASSDKGVRDAKLQSSLVYSSESSSSRSAAPESPLVRHVRQRSKTATPPAQQAGNMSNISEVNSDDEGDVEILLAPVADPGAPTPAMPRLRSMRDRSRFVPTTPSKSSLPVHFEPPEASSTPPKNPDTPSRLRLNPSPGSDRTSILSWEQLAETSRTIPMDELGLMLSETSAPFQPGPLSPMPTGNGSMLLDVPMPQNMPSSPSLSTFNSPSGYGSISQMLLPNTTPSPAAPRHSHSQRQHKDPEEAAVDTAIATLLRLQLSSTETMAKERLVRLQELEEELHNLKQARAHDTKLLSQQVSVLEAQLKSSLEARERSEGEQFAYTTSLEEQLRQFQAQQAQAAREAESMRKNSDDSWRSVLELQTRESNASCAASLAAREWRNVKEQCENELDIVAANNETLELLLGELELARRQLAKI